MLIEAALGKVDVQIQHDNQSHPGRPPSVANIPRLGEVLGLSAREVRQLINDGRLPQPGADKRHDLTEVRAALAKLVAAPGV